MDNSKPLVTFAVFAYNQERLITDAVNSALAQTYSPLEVIISDDCSTDGTFALIEQIVDNYAGPHKVLVHRNEYNLGYVGNVNRVWELSSGDLVVFQGGDDISLPHRTSKLVETWLSHDPHPDLLYSGTVRINEDGDVIRVDNAVIEKTPPIDDTITGRKIFIAGGCANAMSRSLHFNVGSLDESVMAEDFVYSFRALLGNGVVGIPEPLVYYRQHSASILGELRAERKLLGRLRDEKYLKARLSTLNEYKRAMDTYNVKRPLLRWLLNRRIKSAEMNLQFSSSSIVKRSLLMLWAFITLRFRLLLDMLSALSQHSAKTTH